MTEKEFARRVENIGGHACVVGGWVRDTIMGRAPGDKDYVVTGVTGGAFAAEFPAAFCAGSFFPVYLLEIDGEKREVAFARKERKTGRGYKGFAVAAEPSVTIEEDLFRRDLTINSMARSLSDGQLIDPYQGLRDIQNKVIRATSEHFSEDPVRALRAARLSAQLEFSVEPRTLELMRLCGEELKHEPKERVFKELERALAAPRPSIFFRNLNNAGLLAIVFPWLFNLIGKTQPAFCHPEGDAFEHAMLVVDKVAQRTDRPEVRFAALAHDAGKGATAPETLPHHYGHEKTGLDILREIDSGLRLPQRWRQCAEIAIREHMRAPRLEQTGKIRDLLVAVSKHPIGFDGFNAIIAADCDFLPRYLAEHEKYLRTMKDTWRLPIPENLKGREIGLWRRQMEIAALAGISMDEC